MVLVIDDIDSVVVLEICSNTILLEAHVHMIEMP
jgi:hypothetical protein